MILDLSHLLKWQKKVATQNKNEGAENLENLTSCLRPQYKNPGVRNDSFLNCARYD